MSFCALFFRTNSVSGQSGVHHLFRRRVRLWSKQRRKQGGQRPQEEKGNKKGLDLDTQFHSQLLSQAQAVSRLKKLRRNSEELSGPVFGPATLTPSSSSSARDSYSRSVSSGRRRRKQRSARRALLLPVQLLSSYLLLLRPPPLLRNRILGRALTSKKDLNGRFRGSPFCNRFSLALGMKIHLQILRASIVRNTLSH